MNKNCYYKVYYSGGYLQSNQVLTFTCDVIDYNNSNYLICRCYNDEITGGTKIIRAIPHKYVLRVQYEEEIVGDK